MKLDIFASARARYRPVFRTESIHVFSRAVICVPQAGDVEVEDTEDLCSQNI